MLSSIVIVIAGFVNDELERIWQAFFGAALALAIMGGIFVVEALSVMLQVSYFKYTKRKFGTGRRILKMAPLHHHFEKSGWTETQVVIRFWIITMLLCLVGLATLKLR